MTPRLTRTTTVAAILILSIFMVTQSPGICLTMAAQNRVTCRVEADRPVLPADDPQNVILRITLDAPKVPENTALFGGVSQGASEISKNVEDDYVHRVVLLSDGLANVGPRNPTDLGRLGAGKIRFGRSTHERTKKRKFS